MRRTLSEPSEPHREDLSRPERICRQNQALGAKSISSAGPPTIPTMTRTCPLFGLSSRRASSKKIVWSATGPARPDETIITSSTAHVASVQSQAGKLLAPSPIRQSIKARVSGATTPTWRTNVTGRHGTHVGGQESGLALYSRRCEIVSPIG